MFPTWHLLIIIGSQVEICTPFPAHLSNWPWNRAKRSLLWWITAYNVYGFSMEIHVPLSTNF